MALRVLLADESSTIKKVVQLTLQDFDVDVRSVSVGLDVLSVAKTFRPDIVMADVLLAKRSGYEVCHDLKNDPETASIPVVIMWSGFMEIDEQKARLCAADRRIEKPFDAETLRNMVRELVGKTKENPVSSYIQFPPLPEWQEKAPPAAAKPPVKEDTGSVVIDDIDEIEDGESKDEWVQQPPAPKVPPPQPQMPKVPPPGAAPQMARPVAPQIPQPSGNDEFAEFPLVTQPQKVAQAAAQAMSSQMGSVPEEILRQEIQKWLTANMTSIAERIIRDEINRLLQDSDQTIEGP